MSLKAADIVQVSSFAQTDKVTGSYMQVDRHAQVSEKFQVIQPASVGAALAEKGFNLVHCITGKAKQTDKADFQRTISRYRSQDAFGVDGLSLDVIYISKHLGRGKDEMRLGFFRGACANQWASGTLFNLIKFRHTGDVQADIETGIAAVLAQRGQLIETIQKMQATRLNGVQIDALARKYAEIRLQGVENVLSINHRELASVRRQDDAFTDLFTVANVLQENVVKHPLKYTIRAVDDSGAEFARKQSTRQYKESSSQLVDLNGKLFDAAMELIAA